MEEQAIDYQELVELVEGALEHFCPHYCPRCECDISVDRYVDEDDIERWLKVDTDLTKGN